MRPVSAAQVRTGQDWTSWCVPSLELQWELMERQNNNWNSPSVDVHSTVCQHEISPMINLSLRTFGAISDLPHPPLLLHIPRLPLHRHSQSPRGGAACETPLGAFPYWGQQWGVRKYLAWTPAFSNVPWAQKFHWQLSIKSHFYFLYGIYGLVMQYQYMPMVSIYTTMYF